MTLDPEQRQAGIAAGALVVTLFLPWYRKSVVLGDTLGKENLSAFGVFTFVEAAVLLVALGVFVLLYTRSQRKPFHLPGGDGTVIFAAGLWAALLLVWRVFDRPGSDDPRVEVGITWGFFFAFIAAGALAAVGWRMRMAGRPEPHNPVAAELPVEWEERPARRVRTPPDEAATRRLAADDEEPTRVVPQPEPPPEFLRPREDPPDDDTPRLWKDR